MLRRALMRIATSSTHGEPREVLQSLTRTSSYLFEPLDTHSQTQLWSGRRQVPTDTSWRGFRVLHHASGNNGGHGKQAGMQHRTFMTKFLIHSSSTTNLMLQCGRQEAPSRWPGAFATTTAEGWSYSSGLHSRLLDTSIVSAPLTNL